MDNNFKNNLENQEKCFKELFEAYNNDCPFTDWKGFLYHYSYIRAGLSSLLKNPDTMHDPDLQELCDTWRNQRFGDNDTQHLIECYNRLSLKPIFKENHIFRNLYGAYVKSIYLLFNDDYYTIDFFKID